MPGLELCCVDLAAEEVDILPVAVVRAALIFEHAGTERCFENALKMVADGGHLSVVLQLASRTEQENIGSESPVCIQELRQNFRLIAPAELRQRLERCGLRLERETERPLASGKAFWMGIFGK